MLKSYVNTHDLVESDFRKIQELLDQKYGTEYTLDYIRKVCKGHRNNADIKNMAIKYSKLLNKMKSKIDKLSQ
ncbi:hypothetical protein [Ekhidna sp. To15]|uniref:hypothetical protein n=1 Tax=Ekhidna sp. To15 TaxID=3395267 RepID=UPI003F523ADD